MNSKQIAALKYLLAQSKDTDELTKKILWFLIDNSEQMSQPVCISLIPDKQKFNSDEISQIAYGVHDMQSTTGTTNLNELMFLSGCEFGFSVHAGHYDKHLSVFYLPTDSKHIKGSYTIWLSHKKYEDGVKVIFVTKDELTKINLSRPGLYLNFEMNQD